MKRMNFGVLVEQPVDATHYDIHDDDPSFMMINSRGVFFWDHEPGTWHFIELDEKRIAEMLPLGQSIEGDTVDGIFLPYADTKELQLYSLRYYMRTQGYYIVYSDSSVFFRLKDDATKEEFDLSQRHISFENAVRMHNCCDPEDSVVYTAKLQCKGNEVICTNNMIRMCS